MDTILSLLSKYDKPIPRYTSYPTVPYWQPETIDDAKWKNAVVNRLASESNELCIYIHLPYCESLCTFCACNKRITKNHSVEDKYIDTVLHEWKIYRELMTEKPIIREIHLGGGTPTFFSPANLSRLITGITNTGIIPDDHEFSIEVHPNYTRKEHLEALYKAGFTRISLGVQDFDPHVQYIINRIQSFAKTKEVIDWARAIAYNSINIDLVYGLPKQTVEHIEFTISQINQLMPDRIAFYSYAHVPWKSKGQRRYTEEDLPAAEQKWAMYNKGRELLMGNGFKAIGMDHFALQNDKLWQAASQGKMHRNFMGYTTTQNKLIIGLGASSISDSWNAFIQNEKEVEAYIEKIEKGELPIITGHLNDEEDLVYRKHILDLMCKGNTTLDVEKMDGAFLNSVQEKLQLMQGDGLVKLEGSSIAVTEQGNTFIRNICSALDARMWKKSNFEKMFSKAI
ncbi:MAG TPA: oxygen-independent coproporphyrinogen III oxidase [Cytophagales bacterium]|nr:oxygen-independent coproporphyrinogen III oxidase [Cytophagales bacterium]